MMKPAIALYFVIICLISQSFLGFSRSSSIYPIFDTSEAVLLRNFRTSEVKKSKPSLNFKGLDFLNISGSGQFSEQTLLELVHNISLPPQKIIIVDLRQESHGFINGQPVSWTDGYYNYGNLHKSKGEVESDEIQRLRLAAKTRKIVIDPCDEPIRLAVQTVKTEREVVEGLGCSYVRMPVTDLNRPSNEIVDQFVEYMKHLPGDHWVHFHCRAGKGRTTTFMTLFDMMKNGQRVEFHEIIARQKFIGGSDLTLVQKPDLEKSRAANERYEFVKKFYHYCRQVPDFSIRWSEWIDQQQNTQQIAFSEMNYH